MFQPERIDPAKSVYDIRADVWSLGITLVELATAVFPYRGCKTDFEVLTKVLTSNPPRLPEDQGFSLEFRDFVQRCLQKDYLARPKYPDLLKHPFLERAEQDTTTDVAGWFRNVAVSSGIQLTTPQLTVPGSDAATIAAAGVISSGSPIPVSIQRPSSSASDQNRYVLSECLIPLHDHFLSFLFSILIYSFFAKSIQLICVYE